MRDKAIVSRISHGGIEEPVDNQRARLLVDFIFDWLATNRHFDDDIDVMRRVGADFDG